MDASRSERLMNDKSMSHVLPGALSLTLLSVTCSGPSDQFMILQNQVPESGCLISTTRGVYRGSGVLDTALVGQGSPVGYSLHPLVHNGLPAVGEPGGREPNRIVLRSFR